MEKYIDGKIEKKTMVAETDEKGETRQVEKVQTYSQADISNGIATCNRLIAQIEAEKPHKWEHNLNAVKAEKAMWEGYQKMIPKETTIDNEG